MQCSSPIWVRSAKVFVPCGKCGYCLQNKRLDWAFRLEMEARYIKAVKAEWQVRQLSLF